MAIAVVAAGALLWYGRRTNHLLTLTDEYVYLAGARYLKDTGSLDSRYYDVQAILRQGYPHKDHHAPGYMLLLAAAMAVGGPSHWTAVGVNAVAFLTGAFLVHGLARRLGLSAPASLASALLFVVLPAYLAYVFWVLAEVLVGTMLLAALYVAIRFGERVAGAVAAAVVFGMGLLVRESIVFGAPAILLLFRGRRRIAAFLGVTALWIVLVYGPLVKNRAEGGANFWSPAPMPGAVLNVEALRAAREGRVVTAARLALHKSRENVRELFRTDAATEKAILLVYAALPLWTIVRWRSLTALQRRYGAGLVLGWLGLLAVLLTTYTVLGWAGFRYMMFLIPAFLPLAMTTVDSGPSLMRWSAPGAMGVSCIVLAVATFQALTPFKGMRRGATGPRQQEKITAYVDGYIGRSPMRTVVLSHGFLFGLRHYPVEVVWSTPRNASELHVLERTIWFDYLVLTGDDPLGAELDGHRRRYERVNAEDPEPPLRIFKRLTGQRYLREAGVAVPVGSQPSR